MWWAGWEHGSVLNRALMREGGTWSVLRWRYRRRCCVPIVSIAMKYKGGFVPSQARYDYDRQAGSVVGRIVKHPCLAVLPWDQVISTVIIFSTAKC